MNFQFLEKMKKLELDFQFVENNRLKMKFHYRKSDLFNRAWNFKLA